MRNGSQLSCQLIRHIPDLKRFPYPLWRRYLSSKNVIKRAVRSIIPASEPLTVRYIRRTGLHIKMLLDSPEQRYVAHLSAAGAYGEHIDLVYRAAMYGGVPSQHIVGATSSILSCPFSGLKVIILNYVPGQNSNDIYSVDQCRSVGRTMAKLHNVHAPFWGSPALRLPAKESRTRMLAEWSTLQHAISETLGFPWLLDEVKVNRWIEDRTRFLSKSSIFSLIHGDPHQNNVVFDSEGKANLIDLDTAEYSISAIELVIFMLEAQCGLDPGRQSSFIAGYLEQANEDTSSFWEEHAAVATVVAMLILVSSYLSKASTRRSLGHVEKADACVEVARRLWLWRQYIIDTDPTPGIDWLSLIDCAPTNESLTSQSAIVKLAQGKEPATMRHPGAYVRPGEEWML